MAILDFHPHTLRFRKYAAGHEDEDGNYIEGDSLWSRPIKCDAVPNGSGTERTFEDGVKRSYSYTIHLPKTCPNQVIGDKVLVRLYSGEEVEFEVKGFHRYQLKCKMWV